MSVHNHPENTICGESCPARREHAQAQGSWPQADDPISADLPGFSARPAEAFFRPLDPRAGNEFEHLGRVVGMNGVEYPHADGDFVVIGPQCFASADGSVINWRGENYVPQKASLRVRFHNWRVGRANRRAA